MQSAAQNWLKAHTLYQFETALNAQKNSSHSAFQISDTPSFRSNVTDDISR
ncbi:Uncharacterised protein [Vibrio cholerae]|nr:Uncharacterised protein [Vibrio cholerae]CSB63293.1 Uncharacterised protein [Vibrio cholerae]